MDLMTFLLFPAGFVALIFGAEWMVKGASRMAVAMGISPLVVGLTVVAFGTSAPELGVSVMAASAGKSGLAVGNVIGSNICNTLLILGLAALAAPLLVSRQLLRVELPFLIGTCLVFWGMSADGAVTRWEGMVLFGGSVGYTAWVIANSRKKTRLHQEQKGKPQGGQHPGWPHIIRQVGLMAGGLVLLVMGSRWLVNGAVALATGLGVSDLVIGLTVVSIGTSLPEIATSVMASLRGERDMAVGNVMGSNLFNILVVLGLTATVAPAGVPVAASAAGSDIPIMIGAILLCVPIFFTGQRISRGEGGLLFGYYVSYTLYVIFVAANHPVLPGFTMVMTIVIPLTWGILLTGVGRDLLGRYRHRNL